MKDVQHFGMDRGGKCSTDLVLQILREKKSLDIIRVWYLHLSYN